MRRIAHIACRAPMTMALLATLTVVACGRGREKGTDTMGMTGAAAAPAMTPPPATGATTAGPGTAAAPTAAATLTDAQIAHVAVTANSLDSAAGVMATKMGTTQAVKDFGRTMVKDHGAVNKQAVALAKRLNVTPEDNDVSRSLATDAEQSKSHLQGLTGAAFDTAYINHEVAYHQTVLDALDKTLIPQAQNAELKKLLQDARPNFAAHLERAKSIQGTPAAQ